MPSIYDWSNTAANNATADSDINLAEGQAPSTLNDGGRVVLKRHADFLDDIGFTKTAGGTADALTLTTSTGFTAYATGHMMTFIAASNNTGAATLNVSSIGAKAIRKITGSGEVALAADDIIATGHYRVHYNASANSGAGAWILENHPLTTTASPSWSLQFGGVSVGVTYGTRTSSQNLGHGWFRFSGRIILTAKGSSTGSAQVAGPTLFPAVSTPLAIVGANLTGLTGALTAYMDTSGNIQIRQTTSTGTSALTDANFSDTSQLYIAGGYPYP